MPKLPAQFVKLTKPTAIQKLLDEDEKEMHLRECHFQFIVLQINEDNLELMPERIGKVLNLFSAHKTFLGEVSSSVITGFFGFPADDKEVVEKRLGLVAALLKECGSYIRLAHGQTTGLVGIVGGKDSPCRYGAIIPNFSKILIELLDSTFGGSKEILF